MNLSEFNTVNGRFYMTDGVLDNLSGRGASRSADCLPPRAQRRLVCLWRPCARPTVCVPPCF